jgi:hypothetical protein
MVLDACPAPRLAILFWYYASPDVCLNRLRRLRRYNPNTPIFGLYGGPPELFGEFGRVVEWLDDSWCFSGTLTPYWKWRHGDLMISEWFASRGRELQWDSIVVVQWDMLVRAPFDKIFVPLALDDLYLPGLRPLADVADYWWWVRPDTPEGDAYQAFVQALRASGFVGEVWACQFVTAILSRRFLERYRSVPTDPALGFLEYKLPTYAKSFGFNCRSYPHLPITWEADPCQPRRIVLSARKSPIPMRHLFFEMVSPRGARLFHPVTRPLRWGLLSVAAGAAAELIRDTAGLCSRRLKKAFHRLSVAD